jgi:putative hydrolase of the HAD superfamily
VNLTPQPHSLKGRGITALFFDVGGVLLSNGWDRDARNLAVKTFGLDPADFDRRHDQCVADLEVGRLSLDQYLDRTVFYQSRPWPREAVAQFVRNQSAPKPDSLAFVGRLAQTSRYFMATLNNESRDLNDYRIEKFDLRRFFSAFFSSCYLGVAKPEEGIYRRALEITHRRPEECVFIDDRAPNVETARKCAMNGIVFRDVGQLQNELQGLGVAV